PSAFFILHSSTNTNRFSPRAASLRRTDKSSGSCHPPAKLRKRLLPSASAAALPQTCRRKRLPMSPVLQDVRKAYREPDGSALPILSIAEFTLQSGEQAVLVGASGGGKTTLLNVISGITAPDSGSVTIDGIDITRLHEVGRDRFRAQKIGFVFQTFNL